MRPADPVPLPTDAVLSFRLSQGRRLAHRTFCSGRGHHDEVGCHDEPAPHNQPGYHDGSGHPDEVGYQRLKWAATMNQASTILRN